MVEYDGTDFHGFAIQRKLRTVQGELEKAVAKVTEAKTRVVGSGRTDAGAHALGQVVSFKTESRLSPRDLLRALNANLPDDLVGEKEVERFKRFNARRSAVRRHYRYSLWNAELPSVWVRRYRYHVSERLDLEAMNKAVGIWLAHTISPISPRASANIWLRFKADYHSDIIRGGLERRSTNVGFRRCWDRIPASHDTEYGWLYAQVGTGKIAPEDLVGSLDGKSTRLTPWTVPAHGLIL